MVNVHREPSRVNEPIAAAMNMHDPTHWASEFQVLADVLIGGNPPGFRCQCDSQTPLYVSNRDFTFSGAYPATSFAQCHYINVAYTVLMLTFRLFMDCLKPVREND